MSRYVRTMQFRKEINEDYFLNIIEYYKKNRLNGVNDYEIQKIICDNFGYFYENVEMIENIEKMVPGLIEWGSYFPAYIDSGYIRLGLSSAKKLNLKWIEKYPDKPWKYSIIYLTYENIFDEKAKEYMAAYRIQQWWHKITLSPEYKVGRKFINRKYDKLF